MYSRGSRTGPWDSVPFGWYPRSRRFSFSAGEAPTHKLRTAPQERCARLRPRIHSGSGRSRHPHTVQREQPDGSVSSTSRTCNAETNSLGLDLRPILAEFLHPEVQCSHLPFAPAPSTSVPHIARSEERRV